MLLLLLLLPLLFPLSASAENLCILSANSIDSGSTCNSFGAESPFKPRCINNSSSPYGSAFSNHSAANPLKTKTPQFYGLQKKCRDRLSTNPYDPISVSNIYSVSEVTIHQSRSIICTAREKILSSRQPPPILMGQAGASKGDRSPVCG